MAVLSRSQINAAMFSKPNKNHIVEAKYKCLLCWTEIEITNEKFATAVVSKGKNPMCQICGEDTECVDCEVVIRD